MHGIYAMAAHEIEVLIGVAKLHRCSATLYALESELGRREDLSYGHILKEIDDVDDQ